MLSCEAVVNWLMIQKEGKEDGTRAHTYTNSKKQSRQFNVPDGNKSPLLGRRGKGQLALSVKKKRMFQRPAQMELCSASRPRAGLAPKCSGIPRRVRGESATLQLCNSAAPRSRRPLRRNDSVRRQDEFSSSLFCCADLEHTVSDRKPPKSIIQPAWFVIYARSCFELGTTRTLKMHELLTIDCIFFFFVLDTRKETSLIPRGQI